MKKLLLLLSWMLSLTTAFAQQSYTGNTLAERGAWCWFADPRAIHDVSSNRSYIGYIDTDGAVKATQMDFATGQMEEVLVRSNLQPDDHNNPTFLTLPDGRVMIFYACHTAETKFYYRVSTKAGDITQLGQEHILDVPKGNTTYPSPFILSDDPTHIYLCWRGINWHPTIGRLPIPEDDSKTVDWDYGPYQMVQSTGARPYAKYQSNGKDKIYVAYTTGHPDNEYPNWLYFNVVNIGDGSNPTLEDLKGTQLSVIKDGAFNVDKTSSYATSYPTTIVDAPSSYRDWVWQITLDQNEYPAVAFTRISNNKSDHEYMYGHWNGTSWDITDLGSGGGKFHPSNTEYCYSGGLAIDPADRLTLYVSIPTTGAYGSIFEIWKYTLGEDGSIASKTQVTKDSPKGNVRPFVLPGSENSPLRLCWMHGDYQYWILSSSYPQGFPTAIHTTYDIPQQQDGAAGTGFTIVFDALINAANYGGTVLKMNDLTLGIDKSTGYPYLKTTDTTLNSQNIFYTSDIPGSDISNGHTTKKKYTTVSGAITYDGQTLTVFRGSSIDMRCQVEGLTLGDVTVGDGTGVSSGRSKVFDHVLSSNHIKDEESNWNDDYSWTDVSTIALKNPGFDITADFQQANLATGADNHKAVTGWLTTTNVDLGCGGAFGVGSAYTFNGQTAPTINASGSSEGGMLAINQGWNQENTYTQSVSLPAGTYRFSYAVRNVAGQTAFDNRCGFTMGDFSIYDTYSTLEAGEWQEKSLRTFTLTEPTAVKFCLGYVAGNATSTNNHYLFFDYVRLEVADQSEEEFRNNLAAVDEETIFEDIIKDAACEDASMTYWTGGSGRSSTTMVGMSGEQELVWWQNSNAGKYIRNQVITLPKAGIYRLRATVNVKASGHYVKVRIAKGNTITTGAIAGETVLNMNRITDGWTYAPIYYVATTDNEQVVIGATMSSANNATNARAFLGSFEIAYMGEGTTCQLTSSDNFSGLVAFSNATYETGISKYSTLCLPFAYSVPEGMTATLLNTITDSRKVEGTELTEVEANTPVLMTRNDSGSDTKTITGTCFTADYDATAITTDGNLLTSVYHSGESAILGSYVLQNQNGVYGFYRITDGFSLTIPAYHCYLTSTTADVKTEFLSVDDNTTDISTPGIDPVCMPLYNLNGQPISSHSTLSPIYIKGNRKILSK